MDELAIKRAEKTGDSKAWTPTDALEYLLNQIKTGQANPHGLAVHYMEKGEDGANFHHSVAAGMTYEEHIALLVVAAARVLQDWKA